MGVEHQPPYLRSHKVEIVESLQGGKYRPTPVRRVGIPKDGRGSRQLGIPTAVDRVATRELLKRAGCPCLMEYYVKLHPC